MFTKFKNFCAKPITWGDYFKLCGGAFVLSGLAYGATYAYIKYEEHKANKEFQEVLMAQKLKRMDETYSQLTKESE